jgi:hypothetical protein
VQDAHLSAELVRDHEIEPAASRRIDRLDVGDAQAHRNRDGRQELRGNKLGIDGTEKRAPVELGAEEDRERAVAGVADHKVGQAVAVQIGRDDLRGQQACCQRADLHEATIAVGVERDRVIVSIDTGEDRALARVRNPGDVARRIAGVDRDGGLEGAGLSGYGLSVEDVSGAVDDQDIVGAVAVDVGDQGRGMRSCGELSRIGERAVAVAQQDRDGVV